MTFLPWQELLGSLNLRNPQKFMLIGIERRQAEEMATEEFIIAEVRRQQQEEERKLIEEEEGWLVC